MEVSETFEPRGQPGFLSRCCTPVLQTAPHPPCPAAEAALCGRRAQGSSPLPLWPCGLEDGSHLSEAPVLKFKERHHAVTEARYPATAVWGGLKSARLCVKSENENTMLWGPGKRETSPLGARAEVPSRGVKWAASALESPPDLVCGRPEIPSLPVTRGLRHKLGFLRPTGK